MTTLVVLACGAGVIGARAAYVAEFYQRDFASRRWYAILMFQEGGLVFYGGLVLAAIAVLGYLGWANGRSGAPGGSTLPVLSVCDILACAVPVGLAFGRVGCFLNGCCWGLRDLTGHALLAVRFPPGSPAFACHIARYGLPETAACSLPVHATQLYESGAALVMVGLLALAYRLHTRDGQVFALLGVLYGPVRYVIEGLREQDPGAERTHLASWLFDPIANAPMTNSQLVSIAIFAGGVVALAIASRYGPVGRVFRGADAPASSRGVS